MLRSTALLVVLNLAFSTLGQEPRQLDDSKPSLGLQILDTKDALEVWKENKMPSKSAPKKGVMIASVIVGSTAHKAGIRTLDLLDKVNNVTVRTTDRVDELLADKKPGDLIDLQIRRMAPNGSWHPIKGQLKCGTARTAAYSQMSISGSAVNQTQRLSHIWFDGRKNYVSPEIICKESSCSLYLTISTDNRDSLNPKSLTVRAGNATATVSFDGLRGDADIYTGEGEARVHETASSPLPTEFESLLRSTTGKTLQCRVDGFNKYTEFDLTELDQAAIAVALSVYDDIRATKNRDFTLGGRITMKND